VLWCLPSVLQCCWLGVRKGTGLVKNWVVGCWHGYLYGARSRCKCAHGQAYATASHYLLLQYIQIGFTFLVPAHPGSPRKSPGSHKTVAVVVVVVVTSVLKLFNKSNWFTIIKLDDLNILLIRYNANFFLPNSKKMWCKHVYGFKYMNTYYGCITPWSGETLTKCAGQDTSNLHQNTEQYSKYSKFYPRY